MADEAKLHELLDIYEQAKHEGDSETMRKVGNAYKRATAQPAVGGAHFAAPATPLPEGTPQMNATELGAEGKPLYADFFNGDQWKQALKNVGEGAVSAATGMYGTAAGLAAKYNPLGPPGLDDKLKQDIQAKYTYQPKDVSGQQLVSTVGKPVSVASDLVRKVGGDKAVDVFDAAMLIAPFIKLGPAGKGFKRTPEAQRLIDQGVDLTPGQMNPKGIINKLEQATQEAVPLVHPIMRGAREGANTSFQKMVIEKGAAPGTKVAGDATEMLDQAYASFDPMYEKAKGFPVSAQIVNTGKNTSLADAFTSAAKDRSVQADIKTRLSTADWLANKLSALKPKPGQTLDSGQLLDLRSDIRAQIRKNRMAKDSAKNDSADLLHNAEQATTKALESQLPLDALSALREADARYGLYKTIENAAVKAKDKPGGFTPEMLSQAVKEATEKGPYARGGGRLRQEARDAKATLAPNAAVTGAMLPSATMATVLSPITLLGAATKFGRRFARGTTFPQEAYRYLAPEAKRAAIAAGLANQEQP